MKTLALRKAVLGAVLATLVSTLAAQNFSPYKTLAELKNHRSDLTMLCAHRGDLLAVALVGRGNLQGHQMRQRIHGYVNLRALAPLRSVITGARA